MTNAMGHITIKTSRSGTAVTKIFALLLVICLVECATGSCLSYGHSCWGAHGKRSGKAPGSDPGLWYLARILRHMAANEMNHEKSLAPKNDGIDSTYPINVPDDMLTSAKEAMNEDGPMELPQSGNMDGKPMLDDDTLSNIKLWQIMRGTSEEN